MLLGVGKTDPQNKCLRTVKQPAIAHGCCCSSLWFTRILVSLDTKSAMSKKYSESTGDLPDNEGSSFDSSPPDKRNSADPKGVNPSELEDPDFAYTEGDENTMRTSSPLASVPSEAEKKKDRGFMRVIKKIAFSVWAVVMTIGMVIAFLISLFLVWKGLNGFLLPVSSWRYWSTDWFFSTFQHLTGCDSTQRISSVCQSSCLFVCSLFGDGNRLRGCSFLS